MRDLNSLSPCLLPSVAWVFVFFFAFLFLVIKWSSSDSPAASLSFEKGNGVGEDGVGSGFLIPGLSPSY